MQTQQQPLGNGYIELAYDDSPFYQDCVAAVRKAKDEGRAPACMLANRETFELIIEQANMDLQGVIHVHISVMGIPLWLSSEIPDRTVYFQYDE